MKQNQMQNPYPMPKNLKPDIRKANLLQTAYSGQQSSELTALTQYIYHHLEAEKDYGQIAKTLWKIAIMEMRHLDMLGSCIRQLGGDPRFLDLTRGRKNFWSAGAIHYGKNMREMLEADLQGERQAIACYEHIVENIQDPAIEALLQRIIEDEQGHIHTLNGLMKK